MDVNEVEVRWAIFILSMCFAGSLRIVLTFGVWWGCAGLYMATDRAGRGLGW